MGTKAMQQNMKRLLLRVIEGVGQCVCLEDGRPRQTKGATARHRWEQNRSEEGVSLSV